MDLAYAAADFALCRAGAMTCAELTAVGLPAAYVPLPIGNGEQRLNAVPIVQRGGGMLVNDADLTPDWIRDTLLPVLVNIDQVADMSEAAASLGRGDADRWLAEAIIEVVDGKGRGGGSQMLKSLITPADPVPAIHLGRVHFTGIGGAGMSGIARIMLARGISVSGSDAMPSALLDDLHAHGARVHVGHAAGQPRRPRPGGHPGAVQRDPRGQPGAGRSDAAGPAGHAPGRGAGLGHGRTAGDRGRRHAREDDHDVHAHHRAA